MSWGISFRVRQYVKSSLWLVLPENLAAVDEQLRRLDTTVAASQASAIDLDLALSPDSPGDRWACRCA